MSHVKEKIESLKKYVESHKNRLSSPVPAKHAKHPEAFKSYLNLEITKAQRTIDKLVAEGK